jgi:hypothetical protein
LLTLAGIASFNLSIQQSLIRGRCQPELPQLTSLRSAVVAAVDQMVVAVEVVVNFEFAKACLLVLGML